MTLNWSALQKHGRKRLTAFNNKTTAPQGAFSLEHIMTRTDAQRAADKRYATKVKPVTVRLNLTKSDDIAIDRHLDAVGDKTAYIKKLIKDDMKLS